MCKCYHLVANKVLCIKTRQTTNYRPTLQYLPAARRTDIIKPGYPGLEAVKPVNPGLKIPPGLHSLHMISVSNIHELYRARNAQVHGINLLINLVADRRSHC